MEKMDVSKGDILVCKPYFEGRESSLKSPITNEKYGGEGYVSGTMTCSTVSGRFSPGDVQWGFHSDSGVFTKALRPATDDEIAAYELGITNINDIQTLKVSSMFKISYISKSGEIKKEQVEAASESEAIATTLTDLQTLNYIMSDSIPAPIQMTAKTIQKPSTFDVTLENAGKAKLGVVKMIKDIIGIGLKEAKDLIDGCPSLLFEGVTEEFANKIKKELEMAGATASISTTVFF